MATVRRNTHVEHDGPVIQERIFDKRIIVTHFLKQNFESKTTFPRTMYSAKLRCLASSIALPASEIVHPKE
jgi:hypothetical protein